MFNQSVLQLWDNYVLPNVGPKEARTFTAATLNPKCGFHHRVVMSQHFRPDVQGGIYLGIGQNEYAEGRNHYVSEGLVNASQSEWLAQTYFTNPLLIDTPILLSNADAKLLNMKSKFVWDPPMTRVRLGLYQVFTFEFDNDDLNFFKTQMGWLRSTTGKDRDSTMGALFRECSQWVDFEGITVAWSGNKSLHIHITFNTSQAVSMVGNDCRDGLKHHWDALKETVMAILQPGCEPDGSLREPEKYRRLPNGSRTLEKTNLIGIPAGTTVPQITLWEMYRDRAATGAETSFFAPTVFARVYHRAASKSGSVLGLNLLPFSPEFEFCKAKMRAIYDGVNRWPMFHDFEFHAGELRARFFNSPADRKPDSIMSVDFATVSIVGGAKSNPFGLTPQTAPHLPKKLGDMLVEWVAEYEAQQAPAPRPTAEQRFAELATDREAATVAMSNLLNEVIGVSEGDPQFVTYSDEQAVHFISAPEGISKSRTLIESTPKVWRMLSQASAPSLIMYAFATYEIAEEKAAEFAAAHVDPSFGHRFQPLVLLSFTKLYERACSKLKMTRIDIETAANLGFGSIMEAIEVQQSQVIDYFRAYYAKHRRKLRVAGEMRTRIPVIFTVHDVAHDWVKSSPTRLMMSRAWWTETDPQRRNFAAREETALGLLIHDEIAADDLVLTVREDTAQWVETMKEEDPSCWTAKAPMTVKWASFEAFKMTFPPPEPDLTFETVCKIAATKNWETVTTTYHGEYGPASQFTNPETGEVTTDIYSVTAGREWRLKVLDWPTQVAHRVVVLTTESVPAAVVRRIGAPWKVYELDTPLIPKDAVEVRLSRFVTGANLPKLVLEEQADWRLKRGTELNVISNKVSHIANTKTHAKAKGSNGYMGTDILQTMTFMNAEQFERLEVLNAWTGRADLVRRRHIDEFNQTAGRNLGFRRRGDAKHVLLINRRLYEHLAADLSVLASARYDMTRAVTRTDRTNAPKVTVKAPEPDDTPAPKASAEANRRREAIRQALLTAHHRQ